VSPADLGTLVGSFLVALPVGTLVEYLLHRFLLHSRVRTFVARRHRLHHKANRADTLWGDFRDFLPGMFPVGWCGFLISTTAGVGFLLGGTMYVFLLALVHTLSHERPGWIFWMSPNAHALHHGETPRHNFGIVTRFWDVVFRTYANHRPVRGTNRGGSTRRRAIPSAWIAERDLHRDRNQSHHFSSE
jgi:sterol desaturase/sphingolipid hydroxylase (fatty acid hydroxylase superfamily)